MRIHDYRAGLLLAASSIAIADACEAGETVAYTYDALGRLTATSTTGSVNNGVSTGVGYDPAGNRSSYSVTGVGAPPPPPPPSPPPPPPPSPPPPPPPPSPPPPPPPPPPSPPPPPPPANNPPTAVDDHGEGQRCQSRDFNVVANDSDPDGDSLTVTGVSSGDAGFSILSATTIRYTNNGPVGSYSATYTISDGRGGTASATLHVEVPRDYCL